MSGQLYQYFGYLPNATDASTISGVFINDQDLGGNNITNIGTIQATNGVFDNLIVNNDASIAGCINGGAGIAANLCEGAIIGKKLEMPIDQLLNTTNLLNVTTINNSGPPTSVPIEGSIVWTKTDDRLWIYNGAAWQQLGSAPTWSQVLANGNSTGAFDAVISSGRRLLMTNASVHSDGSDLYLTMNNPGNVIANVGAASALESTGYMNSTRQSGACVQIRNGVDPVANIAASSNVPFPFTFTTYDFFPIGESSYIGTNRFILKPLTAYTASFCYSATDPNNHNNSVDLVVYINLRSGASDVILNRQTIYYPNNKSQSEGGCSCTFFTNSNALQELTFGINNTSNQVVRVIEFIGAVTKIN
jgi:hypothetical protein